jgi:hypothetical protein
LEITPMIRATVTSSRTSSHDGLLGLGGTLELGDAPGHEVDA